MESNDKDKPNDKKIETSSGQRKKIFQRKQQDLELKRKLIGSPELFITDKGSDEYLDSLSLKIKLYGGKEFTLEEYINDNLVKYRPRFYKEYYYEIARLHNLPKEVMDNYIKPLVAAQFTINFVYARFPQKVFNRLRQLSKWTDIPGIRENKLFQRLTPIASEQLDLYIDQAYNVAKKSNNIHDFRLDFSKEYHVYFQMDLFDK